MIPNVALVKIEGTIQAFPMTSNGTLMNPSLPLVTEFGMEEYHVVFASYDVKEGLLEEIGRFTLVEDDEVIPAIEVMQQKALLGFTQNAMRRFHENGGKFDNIMEV